jgi:hypothetical protein
LQTIGRLLKWKHLETLLEIYVLLLKMRKI